MPVIVAATASSIAASRKRGQQEVKKDYIHREYSGCYLKVYERKGMLVENSLGTYINIIQASNLLNIHQIWMMHYYIV